MKNENKQAGAELSQAQPKLGLWICWDKVEVLCLYSKLMFNIEVSSSTRITKINYKLPV